MAKGDLTQKQQAYVDARLEGLNQSDAYRRAYDTSRMADKSIWVNASKLEANAKVALRLEELQEKAAEKAVLDKAWVLKELMDNVAKAKSAADFGAANKALELLGKTDELRLFVERTESDNRNHHTAGPISPFDELLARAAGTRTEGTSKDPLPN